MRLEAALAYHDLRGPADASDQGSEDLYKEALASIAPLTAYSAACSIARNKGPKAEAMRRLEYAFSDSSLKEWAVKDPELTELRTDDDFLDLLGLTPRKDFWRLEDFQPYEKRLRAAGIARPDDLYQKEVGQSDISAYLEVSPLVLKRLCRLASLVRRAQTVPVTREAGPVFPYRVEVVAALVQAGIESPEEIHDEWIEPDVPAEAAARAMAGDFAVDLQKAIGVRVLTAPGIAALKAWLRELKKTHDA
jgi:hypothetical protein